MWTPKRVIIWFCGFVLFMTLFAGYSHFLGYIDGLPQLPAEYRRGSSDRPPPPPPPPNDKIFQDACGDDCEELGRPIRLFLRSKGLAFATTHFEKEEDGRVKLSPFTAVVYGKVSAAGEFPEINTVRSEVCYLTLDKPVASFTEIANRKIVKVELACQGPNAIKITNNHRTKETSDDIYVDIVNAPLFYDDTRNLIWSEGLVKLSDFKTHPPTQITAQGTEILLSRDGGAKEKGKEKEKEKEKVRTKKGDSISGVEMIVLKKSVEMHLYMDPQSGFLADSQKEGKHQDAPPAAGDKAHVIIRTEGAFHYDLTRERAHFESDKERPNSEVVVSREHKPPVKSPAQFSSDALAPRFDSKFDEIRCTDLVLHFRPRTAPAGAAKRGDQSSDKEIETALATGPEVRVSMESENLEAYGTEMFYRAAGENIGPQTTIKGQPMMKAVKDGHVIVAPEFHLVGGDKKGLGQHAEAHGKGRIDMLDSSNPKKNYTQHAVWRDEMSFKKITKNGILMDLLVLEGDASFHDDDRQQTLSAQKLFVWLEPGGREPADGSVPADSPRSNQPGPMSGSNQKLHRLEALGKVTYVSPDMRIEPRTEPAGGKGPHDVDCEKLIINTRDKPKKPKLPGRAEAPPVSAVPGAGGARPAASGPVARSADPGHDPLSEPPLMTKKSAPIQLWASTVHVTVLRGNQYELDNLHAEENVHVRQAGESEKDKGVDIRGNALNLVQREKGKILNVDGDPEAAERERKCGRLFMNDMLLVAPRITINQDDNVAQGEGSGYLDMPTNSNLDGSKSAKPNARIIVHWNERMEFNGKNANFFGGVQATQEANLLKCNNLFVTMDKEVSFREGQKDAQNAKVEKILCEHHRDYPVHVLEKVFDEKTGKLIRLQQGQFVQLDVDNLDGRTKGVGPGYVASWSEESLDPKKPANSKLTKMTTKLTRVEFNDRLSSVTMEDKSRLSKFFGNVEVYHLPAAGPDVAINRTQPPEDGFYMNCQLLEVWARPVNGKTCQSMQAKQQVTFKTDKFFCRSDLVKFDEKDDIVIFEALPGNIVRLTKFLDGGQSQQIGAERIMYNRKTGAFSFDGAREISGQQ